MLMIVHDILKKLRREICIYILGKVSLTYVQPFNPVTCIRSGKIAAIRDDANRYMMGKEIAGVETNMGGVQVVDVKLLQNL